MALDGAVDLSATFVVDLTMWTTRDDGQNVVVSDKGGAYVHGAVEEDVDVLAERGEEALQPCALATRDFGEAQTD